MISIFSGEASIRVSDPSMGRKVEAALKRPSGKFASNGLITDLLTGWACRVHSGEI